VLSAYMIAQTLGIIGAQYLLTFGDAATSVLFIGASILVSISFAPILLSATAAPQTVVAQPMSLTKLFKSSPLGTAGIFFLGGIYATQSGMAAVYGTQTGMTADQVALFVAMLFAGALVLQYPIGWLSDRLDRRKLICGAAVIGAIFCGLAFLAGGSLGVLLASAFLAGGVTTPLYALFLAYTNDFLTADDMPAASGGLVFTFGLGAILGPLVTGVAMEQLGPFAFWLVLGGTFGVIALYALYRMTQRAVVPVAETESYISVLPTASPVAVEAAGVWAAENAEAEREAEAEAEAEAGAEREAAAEAPDPNAQPAPDDGQAPKR
jgi:predicted MFS family arabinose efflux permease